MYYTAETIKNCIDQAYEVMNHEKENLDAKINSLEMDLEAKRRECINSDATALMLGIYSIVSTMVAIVGWIVYIRS